MPNALFLARNLVLTVVVVLSFAVIGLCTHWTQLTSPEFLNFQGLGLVTGALTILLFTPLLAIGIFRKNAIFTTIAIELPIVVVLSILYVAEGAITNNLAREAFPVGCSPRLYTALGLKVCKEFMAIKGISFAIFAILIFYWLPLLVLVVIGLTQGQNTFGQSVAQLQFRQPAQASDTFAPGLVNDAGMKEFEAGGAGDMDAYQQQQIQLQQLQLQQLQQQQAMLQQQQLEQHTQA